MNNDTDQEVASLKAFAIEMSRDPREGLTARQRALMACIVIPAPIQQWMIEAGVVETLLDSVEKTILAAEEPLRAALRECAKACDLDEYDLEFRPTKEAMIARAALGPDR